MSEIPYGYCHCGCGRKTKVSDRNRKKRDVLRGEPMRFISGHGHIGTLSGHGRHLTGYGYVHVLCPGHPRANKKGYVPEHILVLEKALGRPILPTEASHHRDKIRSNNLPGNLMLFKTNAMHAAFHKRLRAFEATGHWDWRQCEICHQYDDPKNLWIGGRTAQHRQCGTEQTRKWRENHA